MRKVRDWTDESSERITGAYRRFLYLKAVSGEVLTPPYWIDDAWHLHQAFPQDYAALETAIGRSILHRRDLARDETRQAYARGRALWQVEFDAEPPKDLWPSRDLLRRNRIKIGLFLLSCWAMIINAESFGFWTLLGGLVITYFVVLFVEEKSAPDSISRCG